MQVVADTSALVSLGVVLDRDPNPLEVVLDAHEVVIPERVLSEVEATARFRTTPLPLTERKMQTAL